MRYALFALLALLLSAADVPSPELRLDTEAPEAVLDMLDDQAAGRGIESRDWERLRASAGYRRLMEREAGIGVPFTDQDFRAFVEKPELIARRQALRETLERWRTANLGAAAARAAAYLPQGARIRATVFPMIKPRTNSFIFDAAGDPAIFLYLDPDLSAPRFENTVAHEFHHIGYAAACKDPEQRPVSPMSTALDQWSSAFGEGVAMLAAAGGPDIHPHAVSPAEDRARWDLDVANYSADFARVAAFFEDIRAGRLDEAEATERGMSFFGVQGPWYTVGWRMAERIETRLGRSTLVASLCDRRAFFTAYNQVADDLPRWPREIIEALP